MKLSWRARRFWSIVVLLVGLPLYVVAAVTVMSSLPERPPLWLEAPIYVVLGIAWAFPLRWLFRGIARDDPDRPPRG